MKRILFLVVATFMLATTINAQTTQNGDHSSVKKEWRKAGKSKMEKLNLTAAQQEQVKKVREDAKAQRAAIMKDNSLSQEQKSAKIKELRKADKEKMNAIYTPGQRKQLKTYQMKGGKMHAKSAIGKGKNRQMSKLNLTNEQKEQMQKIRQDSKSQQEAIQQNSSLTQEQKAAKMKDLSKARRDQMNSVLTQEQKNQLKNDWNQKKMQKKTPPSENQHTNS